MIQSNTIFGNLKGHWAQSDIELMANKHIVDGVTASTFVPDTNIKRAEFAALLVRSLGLAEETAGGLFTDVRAGYWYAAAARTAQKAGLINGYEDGSFRPTAYITRGRWLR